MKKYSILILLLLKSTNSSLGKLLFRIAIKLSNNNYEQLYFINCLNFLPSCSVILSSKYLQKNGNLISYENFENGYRIISNKCMKINTTTNQEDISEFLSKTCEVLS